MRYNSRQGGKSRFSKSTAFDLLIRSKDPALVRWLGTAVFVQKGGVSLSSHQVRAQAASCFSLLLCAAAAKAQDYHV